ncbi:MAG TPA: hypothetical protein VMJ70_05540 [Candidatus Sulfotelmatobacter sp.]|nr:hypothetical protein [Candidatus Sulfotelmatobacter sp.]
MKHARWLAGLASTAALALWGCSASEPAHPAPPPAPPASSYGDRLGPGAIVSGASDSVGSLPGSAEALYRYRFRQTQPGSSNFTYYDRETSWSMKPTPDAIHFQLENKLDRPITIDWEKSSIVGPWGQSDKVAHSTTRWADRFSTQPATTVSGLQRYGDYVFPLSYLVDPGSSDQQLHRPLYPEDNSAQQYTDRETSVTIEVVIDGRPRDYAFTFKAVSVLPK